MACPSSEWKRLQLMDIEALNTSSMNLASQAVPEDSCLAERAEALSTLPDLHSPSPVSCDIVEPANDADAMFTHAPVSLWEEDFSEVKQRFSQLKANGIVDLRKHFKKHPEDVLSLARMVKIVRINKQTLALYDAAGPVEFHEGLSPIFNRDSFAVFQEELIAFWKGSTSFSSEAVNLTLAGTSKNILIHAIIPPGYEQSWAKVYVAITDITAIKDSMRRLVVSEQKYRNVFNAVPSAVLLVDVPSGMVIEANKSAKRLLGAVNGELSGLHLADLVQGEERNHVRALLRVRTDHSGISGRVMHVRHRTNGAIPVTPAVSAMASESSSVIVVTLAPVAEKEQARSAAHKGMFRHPAKGAKLSAREREILGLICSGKSNRTIAQCLSISDKTVETHRTRLMQKLDAHCVVDLVRFAVVNGLAQLQ